MSMGQYCGPVDYSTSLNDLGELADDYNYNNMRMVESSSHGTIDPPRTPEVDINFNGRMPDFLGTNATSTQYGVMTTESGPGFGAYPNNYSNCYDHQSSSTLKGGSRSQEVIRGGEYPGQALSNLQAKFFLYGQYGFHQGMNSAPTLAAPSIDKYGPVDTMLALATPYPQRITHLNPSVFNAVGPNLNGLGNGSESVTIAFEDGGNNSWPDLLTCQTYSMGINIASHSNMSIDSRLGMADDGSFVTPQSPISPRGHQKIGVTTFPSSEQFQKDNIYFQAPAGGIGIGDDVEGDASGQRFDLNKVPAYYAEETPKRREKYHPIVAKDKRTYKKRKVDSRKHETSQLKKLGQRGKGLGHETDPIHCTIRTSEAGEMGFSRSPADGRGLTSGGGGGGDDVQSPMSSLESQSCSDWGSPHSSYSKSPSVRRNLFATQSIAQDQEPPPLSCSPGSDPGINGARSWYNVGEHLAILQEMLDVTTAMRPQEPFHSDTALSHGYDGPGVQSGTMIVPAMTIPEYSTSTVDHSFNHIRSVCSSSFQSRSLCPRGIINPHEIPFRNMSNIQRVVYLKSTLLPQWLEMSPESLLQHVHDHLPDREKEDFKSLWNLILAPVTHDHMQQLAQLAEMKLRNSFTMTLWPDLIGQEQSNGECDDDPNSQPGLEIVPFENKAMVPFNPLRKRKTRPKVELDTETIRVWKLLVDKKFVAADTPQTDSETELKWDEERRKMQVKAMRFIDRMHIVQGDRSFSCWKGSVVDSIVGAYLTQNVNDVLSSSAFMSMRSRFPGRGSRNRTSTEQSKPDVAESPEIAKTSEESDDISHHGESSSSTYDETNPSDIADAPPALVLESQADQRRIGKISCDEKYYLQTKESQAPTHLFIRELTYSDFEQSSMAARASNPDHSGIEFEGVDGVRGEINGVPTSSVGIQRNTKSPGLTGLERAKREEERATAKKSFEFSELQAEFHPRVPGDPKRPAAPPRTEATQDGVDWEAVRSADVMEVADVIKARGLNWILAGRIKAFLERIHRDYGELDLEWLRSMPTDQTKDFLLSIRGLGLKSVECIRLLTLHHLAFPVDTNVGRICVRLGWVPLEPLPEELQLHLLELYPVQATIQKYLWPRLCKLDQATLYELHYQMITFGKVFCTKSKPNCNACPMRPECKHFASALSSAKLALPASEGLNNGPTRALPPGTGESNISEASYNLELARSVSQYVCQPIVEEPMTPESDADMEVLDIEDSPFLVEEVDQEEAEILSMCTDMQIKSNITEPEPVKEAFLEADPGIQQFSSDSDSCQIKIVDSNEGEGVIATQATVAPSQEMVPMAPGSVIPVPKLKNVGRLRTVHYVYELPGNHALLVGLDPREDDDPCTYLLAIWSPGEVPESIPSINDSANEDISTLASSSSEGEECIKATLLVPCRTAMKGSFPLNGTYFQVNEVFADHESSLQPMLVPRKLLWNLRRRFVYFGTTVTSIFRGAHSCAHLDHGMTVEEIQACFWRGYVCVRGFDRTTRAPKPLVGRLHLYPNKSSGKGANLDS